MSLVSEILEGYNNRNEYGDCSLENVDPEAYARATIEGTNVDEVLLENAMGMVDLDRVINAADIMGSMTMILEGHDVSAAMEGVIANGFERIRNFFIKLKNQIVAWFKKAIDSFVSYFKNGKEFVKKYGDVIKKKDLSGFKFTGYNWTKSAGDAAVDKANAGITSEINGMVNDMAKAADMDADKLSSVIKKTSDGDKDYKNTVVKGLGLGVDSIGDMKKKIIQAYRDGKDSSTSDLTISSSQVTEYLSYIETGKDMIKKLKDQQKDFENKLNAVIKTVNTIERKADKGSDAAKNANAISKCLNDLFMIKRHVADCQVGCYRTMLKSETGILRKLLHYSKKEEKATSEAYDAIDDMYTEYPLLESDDFGSEEESIECDFNDTEESYYSEVGEGVNLYNQIANMLGI